MTLTESLESLIPDYAKDIRLNIRSVFTQSNLNQNVVLGCALAAAITTGNKKLISLIHDSFSDETERQAAKIAAALMAQNNVWYSYVDMVKDPLLTGIPVSLRMNAIGNHGGTTKENFEAYSLCASIVGKCVLCVKAHYKVLRDSEYTMEQVRDIGRIAATVNALSKLIEN